MQYAIYIASAIGAAAIYLMMPQRGKASVRLGMLLGAAAFGGLWLLLAKQLPEMLGIHSTAMAYQYVFSAIAIGGAARVITHSKPVYSALWFVMVILASAGLFLTLEAQFMAFAMIIIYGGAILVTYVFVIMLASSNGDAADNEVQEECDTVAREPAAALAAGFLLLAVLLTVMFEPAQRIDGVQDAPAAMVISTDLTNRAEARLDAKSSGDVISKDVNAAQLDNIERVGLDLFDKHPLGLELAGVILLVSLVGAVVIARKQVEAKQSE